MAHTPTIRAIKQYATDAIQQNDPTVFLREFGPLHKRWHTTSLRNNIGFLLFHWNVVTQFKRCHADRTWPGGVHAFTPADWNNFGWPYNVTAVVNHGDFNSLAAFSTAIENWHNEAHMAVGMANGEDLMNPATNIFLRDFWRLHYFINARFLTALAKFDTNGTAAKRVARIEKNYDTRLGAI
jgi:hypothetical protein